jgi:glycosyltransferase involved in cell wall biosynthesis
MLTVVMPAHNEAGYLETAVRDVHDGLRARGLDVDILVVENGSTDDTRAIALRLAEELPAVRVTSRGRADYGAALCEGILAAKGESVLTFDVDYYDLGFADRALALLRRAEDPPVIVVGSKRAPGAADERPWPRRLVTAAFAWLLRVGFSLSVSDTHGMKALRRGPIDTIVRSCRFRSDLFDTELVIRTERAGLPVAELPVRAQERRPSRTPIWLRVPRTLVGLFVLRWSLWREPRAARRPERDEA